VGAQLYQPTLEEISLAASLDRLADLLTRHPPERRAVFWDQVMSKRKPADPPTISDRLRHAITASGLTHYAIGKAAGVDPGVISRFTTGERTLRLETVDRIAAALGLRLTDQAV
jgi:Helix-turn-helix domain